MCLNVYKTYGVDSEFSQAATWQENPLFVEKIEKTALFQLLGSKYCMCQRSEHCQNFLRARKCARVKKIQDLDSLKKIDAFCTKNQQKISKTRHFKFKK